MATHLRLYKNDRTALGLLPDHAGLVHQVVHNDAGTLTFQYPLTGVRADLLNQDVAYLALVVDGVEWPDWFLLDDDTDDLAAAEGDSRLLQVSSRGLLALLEHAIVYPPGHVPGGAVNGKPVDYAFKNITPGLILSWLIDRAKLRGCFPDLEYDFTATHDSDGQAWPTTYSVTYPVGTSLYEVARGMADNGWLDLTMDGFTLKAYKPDTVLNTLREGFVLRLGKQVLSAPRKKSRRGILSHLLGIGAEKIMVEQANTATATKWGRREGNAADGQLTTAATVTSMASVALQAHAQAREGYTLKIALDPPPNEVWPIPGEDYVVGDRIYYDKQVRAIDGQLEPVRVRTMTWEWESAEAPAACSIEVNDVFVERGIKFARRLAGVSGGSVISAPPPPKTSPKDTTTPGPPTNLGHSATDYFQGAVNLAKVNVGWDAPMVNTDGSDYDDHSKYDVQYRLGGSGDWLPSPSVQEPGWTRSALPPGAQFEVRVRAVDTSGHVSTWATLGPVTLPKDETPPPVPSQLIATTRLGVVTVYWDGLDESGGGGMPPDFAFLEVYRSTDDESVAPAGTLIGRIFAGNGSLVISDLPYGVPQYFTAIAYDLGGNVSEASEAVEAITKPLVDTDLIGKVIDAAAHIIDGTIFGPAIAPGAVTTEKLTVGSVGDELVLNGSFEEVSTVDPSLPATWKQSTSHPGPGAGISFETAAPIAGSRSMKLAVTSFGLPASHAAIESRDFPVEQFQVYSLRATVKDSAGTSPGFYLGLIGGATVGASTSVEWIPSAGAPSGATVPTATTAFSGQVSIPAGWKYARVIVLNYSDSSTSAHTLTVDSVSCRRVIVSAQIGEGQITTPKLAALAVEADKIAANAVVADKIEAGAVTAEKVALGVVRSNLVPDPSFEEQYEVTLATPPTYGVGDKIYRWRRDPYTDPVNQLVTKTQAGRARGGRHGLALTATDSSSSAAVSGVFPLEPGKDYALSVYAASVGPTSGNFGVSVIYGTGDETSITTPNVMTLIGDDTWPDPPIVSDPVDPALMERFAWTFTAPVGVTFAVVRLANDFPPATCTVVVDDVAVVEIGNGGGAAEVTSAGLRLFGPDGLEIGAFVSNRPNYFSVTSGGKTVASINAAGDGSFNGLSVVGDPIIGGVPLIGKLGASLYDAVNFLNDPVVYDRDYEVDPVGIIEQYAKGTVAWAQFAGSEFTQSITANEEMSLFELGFDMEPGRQYTFRCSPILMNTNAAAGAILGIRLRATLDGSVPGLSSQILNYSYATPPVDSSGNVSLILPSRLVNGGATAQTQLRVLLCVFAGTGITSASVYDSQSILPHIEDLGPVKEPTGDVRNYKTGGTTGGGTTGKKTYVKTYTSNGSGTYRGNGTKRTDTSDVVQGYNSYNGNGEGLWTFPSMTGDLSGATVNKVEVYAYAHHWYYPSGGTARVMVHGYSSEPASSPSQTLAKTVTGWKKPQGLWVTLPSSLYAGFKTGTYKGFGMGPGSSTSLTQYGRFAGSGAKIRVTYTK